MSETNWRIYDYDRKLLGEVVAGSVMAAMRLAREVWPEQLNGDLLFDVIPGDMTDDPLIKLLRKASRHE